jgi:hypothetical protein
MTTDEANMREAVQRGFAWLRTRGSAFGLDWERINPKNVDMASSYSCVLALASLDEHARFDRIVRDVVGENLAWADSHGFSWPGGNTMLTNEWRRVLTEAREQQDQADLAEALLIS